MNPIGTGQKGAVGFVEEHLTDSWLCAKCRKARLLNLNQRGLSTWRGRLQRSLEQPKERNKAARADYILGIYPQLLGNQSSTRLVLGPALELHRYEDPSIRTLL